jgi:hypothetical protein
MTRRDRPGADDPLARLDPDVAALARAASGAAERAQRERKKTIFSELDGRPTELKLKPGPAAILCLAAGVVSAAGAITVFNMGEADLLWLAVSQTPAAGLMAIAWRAHEQRKGQG